MKGYCKLVLWLAMLFISASGCAHDKFAEFRQYEREANGRFLGVLGFALDVPGVDRFEERFSYRDDVFVIPGTSDSFFDESELDYNRRAAEFAERHNRQILRKKKADPVAQHNAGDRPPMNPSPASDTLSSPAPRG